MEAFYVNLIQYSYDNKTYFKVCFQKINIEFGDKNGLIITSLVLA